MNPARGRAEPGTGARAACFAVAGALWLLAAAAPADEAGRSGAAVSTIEMLSSDAAGFARALAPRAFRFPADDGPHPAFRTEWWYFTGHLRAADGRRFGFQFTLFRFGLAPLRRAPRASRWAATEAYLGHLALTDPAGGRFHTASRTRRAALGLAGAQSGPLRVWLDDWRVEAEPGRAPGHLTLVAAADGFGLRLRLEPGKPLVANGDRGLSAKGPEPGNASYYYSRTRMPATGSVDVDGDRLPVTGHAWMDREWGTSTLPPGVTGWDWVGLQLDDGRDLLYYRLRGAGGAATRESAGTLVGRDGRTRALSGADVTMRPVRRWRSPASGIEYPVDWALEVPSHGLSLRLAPVLDDQEWRGSFRYWEGQVRIVGEGPDGPVEGFGYLEMTGYDSRQE